MARLVRGGVGLDYEEHGTGDPPIVLVHGILCDRRYLAPQQEFFSGAHRTVAVDLRGHGLSDVPQQGYSIDGLADDLGWMCVQLDLSEPVLVGHSLGGIVALACAARHPELVGAVVALDSVLLIGDTRKAAMATLLRGLRSNEYLPVVREYFRSFFAPADDLARQEWILGEIARVPPRVGIAIWEDGTFRFDDAAAVSSCRAPFLYIDAGTPNVDLDLLRRLSPNLTLGRTVGSGHFHQLEVPEQVNSMVERFLHLNAMGLGVVTIPA